MNCYTKGQKTRRATVVFPRNTLLLFLVLLNACLIFKNQLSTIVLPRQQRLLPVYGIYYIIWQYSIHSFASSLKLLNFKLVFQNRNFAYDIKFVVFLHSLKVEEQLTDSEWLYYGDEQFAPNPGHHKRPRRVWPIYFLLLRHSTLLLLFYCYSGPHNRKRVPLFSVPFPSWIRLLACRPSSQSRRYGWRRYQNHQRLCGALTSPVRTYISWHFL